MSVPSVFQEACRRADIETITQMIQNGYPAYLHGDRMFQAVFESGSDDLFHSVVRYLKLHPLNALLRGGLLRRHSREIAQYNLYMGVRDDVDEDRLHDLLSRWADRDPRLHFNVRLASRLVSRPSPPPHVISTLRTWRLSTELDRIEQNFQYGLMATRDDDGQIRVSRLMVRGHSFLDTPAVIWSFVPDSQPDFWPVFCTLDPALRTGILTGMLLRVPFYHRQAQFLDRIVASGCHDIYWDIILSPKYVALGLGPTSSNYVASCKSGDVNESVEILLHCLPEEFVADPPAGAGAGIASLLSRPDFREAIVATFSDDELLTALHHSRDQKSEPLVRMNTALLRECYHVDDTVLRPTRVPESVDEFLTRYETPAPHPDPDPVAELATLEVAGWHFPRDDAGEFVDPHMVVFAQSVQNLITFNGSHTEFEMRVRDLLLQLTRSPDHDPVTRDLTRLLTFAHERELVLEMTTTMNDDERDRVSIYTAVYHLHSRGLGPQLRTLRPEKRDRDLHRRLTHYWDRRTGVLHGLVSKISPCEDTSETVNAFLS